MGAGDFTEIVAWRLADQLARFMSQVVQRPALARDFDCCRQAKDAAESAPRNIAEGFGRFAPREFAQFLRIAIGSEHETRNHILTAASRGAITEAERDEALMLTRRAITAAVRLRRYLLSPRGLQNAARIENP